MTIRWYNDADARLLHKRVEEYIKPMCVELMSGYAYTHMGINRNEFTQEVTIKLHLRPIGEAYWIDERLKQNPLMLGSKT